jgi:hypothetical protein
VGKQQHGVRGPWDDVERYLTRVINIRLLWRCCGLFADNHARVVRHAANPGSCAQIAWLSADAVQVILSEWGGLLSAVAAKAI